MRHVSRAYHRYRSDDDASSCAIVILPSLWQATPVRYGELMQISKEDLDKFKRIYKDEFGEELTEVDASAMASDLLDLYELLMQPLPENGSRRADSPPHPTDQTSTPAPGTLL